MGGVRGATPLSGDRYLVITELFLPTKGGTATWFDEVYRRLGGKEIHIVTADVPDAAQHDAAHPNVVHRLRLRRHWWMRRARTSINWSATAVWVPIGVEGAYEQILKGLGLGHNWKGLYATSLLERLAGWRERSNQFSEIFKLGMICAEHMRTVHHGRYYAKAQNLSRKLKAAYDVALERCDLLLMPTTPVKGVRLPPANPTRAEDMAPGFIPIVNTAPIDCTGHPSINVPCAMRDGLPVGMMLTGRHFDEMTLYRAADAFEKAGDWKSR